MSEELTSLKQKIELIEKYLGEDFKKFEEKEKNKNEEISAEEFYAQIMDLFFQKRTEYKNRIEEIITLYKNQNIPVSFEETIIKHTCVRDAFCALAITKAQLEKEIEDIRKLIKNE